MSKARLPLTVVVGHLDAGLERVEEGPDEPGQDVVVDDAAGAHGVGVAQRDLDAPSLLASTQEAPVGRKGWAVGVAVGKHKLALGGPVHAHVEAGGGARVIHGVPFVDDAADECALEALEARGLVLVGVALLLG